jgi:hypothetical protein
MYKQTVNNFVGNYKNTIDVADIARGIYFLNISGTNGNINKKVIVK